MRKLFFLLLVLSTSLSVFSQEKVKWSFTYNSKLNQIELTAEIADGWHMYSQHLNNDIGPVPTSFVFNEISKQQVKGEVIEPKPVQEYDPNFEANLDFFKHKVVFIQKLKKGTKGKVEGSVTYMVCNETMCLPPTDVPFSIEIK
jgi:Disulphide bond corrector protein DsbC